MHQSQAHNFPSIRQQENTFWIGAIYNVEVNNFFWRSTGAKFFYCFTCVKKMVTPLTFQDLVQFLNVVQKKFADCSLLAISGERSTRILTF